MTRGFCGDSGGLVAGAQKTPEDSLRLAAMACRWRKSASELSLMRQSSALAADAIYKCMQESKPGISEHQLAARFGAPLCALGCFLYHARSRSSV